MPTFICSQKLIKTLKRPSPNTSFGKGRAQKLKTNTQLIKCEKTLNSPWPPSLSRRRANIKVLYESFLRSTFALLQSQESTNRKNREREHRKIQMAPDPEEEVKDEKNPRPLDEDDIALLKTYVCLLIFLPGTLSSLFLAFSPFL